MELPQHGGLFICFDTMTLISVETKQAEYHVKHINNKWYFKNICFNSNYFRTVHDENWIELLSKYYTQYLVEKILLGDEE